MAEQKKRNMKHPRVFTICSNVPSDGRPVATNFVITTMANCTGEFRQRKTHLPTCFSFCENCRQTNDCQINRRVAMAKWTEEWKMRRFHFSRLNEKRNRSDIQPARQKKKRWRYLLDGFLTPSQAPDIFAVAFI